MFPGLTSLSVEFDGWTSSIPTFLGSLHWPCLESLQLSELWASEDHIIDIFTAHKSTLKCFVLIEPALTDGTWRTLITRIRNFATSIQVVLQGELFGCSSQESITMNDKTEVLLQEFIYNTHLPWPFNT
jgi:hypothetical protein